MSVISSHLSREPGSWTGAGDAKSRNNFSVQWLVESNDIGDGPLVVAIQSETAAPDPTPGRFAPYSVRDDFDPTVFCLSKTTKLQHYVQAAGGNHGLWIVTAGYGKPEAGETQEDQEPNPLERPTKYRLDFSQFTHAIERDVHGKAIVNSAQQFLTGTEVDDDRPVLVATKNFGSFTEVVMLALAFRRAINTNSFYGASARHAKVESISCSDIQEENGVQFYSVTIRVEFSDEPWTKKLVDRGFKHFDVANPATRKLVEAKDDHGNASAEPVLLDQDGTRLPAGQDGRILEFDVYPERDFSALGI